MTFLALRQMRIIFLPFNSSLNNAKGFGRLMVFSQSVQTSIKVLCRTFSCNPFTVVSTSGSSGMKLHNHILFILNFHSAGAFRLHFFWLRAFSGLRLARGRLRPAEGGGGCFLDRFFGRFGSSWHLRLYPGLLLNPFQFFSNALQFKRPIFYFLL